MNAKLKAAHIFAAAVALSTAGCLLPHRTIAKTIDRSAPLENAGLWRQVKRGPAAYVPKSLPAGARTGPAHGKWIVDPQDSVSYFVPRAECGGLTPGVWEGEALKATNRPLGEQMRRNAATVLLRWPLEASGNAILLYGSGGGGGGGVPGYGSGNGVRH